MAKVSIGLRGWRFEESEIFTDDGEFKPLEEIPEEDRQRLVRLPILMERPCAACYLIHGEEDKQRCREAALVYGEPLDEVVLCDRHEADFIYWYREAGGREVRGTDAFVDDFHEWFADGGRAPEGYRGTEHVDTDPDSLPDPPSPQEVQERIEAGFEGRRFDLREYGPGADEAAGGETGEEAEADADEDAEAVDPDEFDDLDLGQDYPTR